jgi:protein-S-isoprenylcysteine O-methyltransferase Ste14
MGGFGMEWFPQLQMGWLNGWLPLLFLALTDGLLFWVFPKKVVKRLFERSGWSHRQITLTVIGKLFAVVCVVLVILSPLKVGSSVFYLGLLVIIFSAAGLAWALLDYRYTPMDEPVVRGIYRLSRHPQILMSSFFLLGACLAVGSWTAILLLLITRLFSHPSLVAEEEACLRLYGERYQAYRDRTPRYFIFF